MADKIEMNFPASTTYIGIVRLAASGLAGALEYTLNEIEDLKSCISEACLLLMFGQECTNIFIEIQVDDNIKITVNAINPKPDNDAEFEGFSEEISRIMIEALSDESEFIENNGILQSVSFVIRHQNQA